MKYPLIAFLCASQLFHAPMAFAVGEAVDIAKYSRYEDLTVYGRYTLYTPQIRQLYSMRGNRSVWFTNGRSNGKIQTLISFAQSSPDVSSDLSQKWVPVLRRLSRDMGRDSWISVEMVASYILLMHMTDMGIRDYSVLNRAIDSSLSDFSNFLYNPQAGANNPSPLNVGTDSAVNHDYSTDNALQPGADPYAPKPFELPKIEIKPLDPIGTQAPMNDSSTTNPVTNNSQVPSQALGLSTAHYVNDPTSDDINKFYAAHQQSIWVDASRNANSMASALRSALRGANRHGLDANDYWDSNLENMYQNPSAYGDQFELGATKSFLRYVNHLTGGRLDPQAIDPKLLKFTLRKFQDLNYLSMMIQGGPGELQNSLDMLAPQIPQYKQLMNSLDRLATIKQQGTWKKIGQPEVPLKLGVAGFTVSQLRSQLSLLGYANVGAGDTYDNDLAQAVKVYLSQNGLEKMDYRFWNSFYVSVDYRIQQVQMNLEKLRWLPMVQANRFAFVNLAAQELRLQDEGRTLMKFKTVNGKAERATPSMLQQSKRVLLNPTWTTPVSLAMKDKIPAIQNDKTYMKKHNMFILDTRTGKYLLDPRTNQPVTDLSTVDMSGFTSDTKTNRYYFVQGPGNQNALGVLKFPLQNMDGSANADDIYMHDTNERELFKESFRYRSSGCIRLEYPLEFAAYLLKDGPRALTIDDIKAKVPWENPEQLVASAQTNEAVSLGKPLTIIVMYLTAEQNEDGSFRLFEDTYGIDAKMVEALKASH